MPNNGDSVCNEVECKVTGTAAYFSLSVFSCQHVTTDTTDKADHYLILAHDKEEALNNVRAMFAGISGYDHPKAWRVGQILDSMSFVVVPQELLRGMDRWALTDMLRRAGWIARDVMMDGQWFACIGRETESESEPSRSAEPACILVKPHEDQISALTEACAEKDGLLQMYQTADKLEIASLTTQRDELKDELAIVTADLERNINLGDRLEECEAACAGMQLAIEQKDRTLAFARKFMAERLTTDDEASQKLLDATIAALDASAALTVPPSIGADVMQRMRLLQEIADAAVAVYEHRHVYIADLPEALKESGRRYDRLQAAIDAHLKGAGK